MHAWTSVWMFGFYCSCCWSHPLSLKPWISHSVSCCLWIIGKRPTWTSVWMFGHCNCCCCCSLSSLKAAFSLIGWLSANHRLLLFSHLLLGVWTGCKFLQLCKKISCKLQSWLLPPLPPSLCGSVSHLFWIWNRVHIYNVEEIILCVLPYHETTLFVRIVKILHLK